MDVQPLGALPPVALAETCRVVGEAVPLWPFHRERLGEGGCGDDLLDVAERALFDAVRTYVGDRTSRLRAHLEIETSGVVSIEVERRLSSLDVVNGPVLVPVSAHDLGAARDGRPDAAHLPACGAKPADRSWWDAAAREARRLKGHQALIVDESGSVIDGSSANVWLAWGATLATPAAPPAIAGVARRLVLARAEEVGLRTDVRELRLEDVESADEVILTNAYGGAVAARGRGGSAERALRELFASVWDSGRSASRAG